MAWLKRFLLIFVILIACVYVILFSLRNTVLVDLDLFFITLNQVPIELAVVGSFIIGGLLGVLSSFSLLYRMRKKYRQALFAAKQNK
jgi:uncharacterized integral membrane protein